MNWLSLAVKIITAIPQIKNAFILLMDYFNQSQIEEYEKFKSNEKARKIALIHSIKQAKSNEDRKQLSILLHYHIIGKLPDTNKPVQSSKNNSNNT